MQNLCVLLALFVFGLVFMGITCGGSVGPSFIGGGIILAGDCLDDSDCESYFCADGFCADCNDDPADACGTDGGFCWSDGGCYDEPENGEVTADNGCVRDSECGLYEFCNDGMCTPKSSGLCNDSGDCVADAECVDGSCYSAAFGECESTMDCGAEIDFDTTCVYRVNANIGECRTRKYWCVDNSRCDESAGEVCNLDTGECV